MLDPWAEEPAGPRPFAVPYRKGSGEGLVYGGLIAGAIALAVFMTAGEPLYVAVAFVGLAATYYFYPLIETGRPQLGANDDGLYVAGIGFVDWAEIAQLELFRTSVRMIVMNTLIVTLARPLDEAVVKREKRSPWRLAMTRCYTRKSPTRIEIPLHPLRGDADEILARLKAYRPGR